MTRVEFFREYQPLLERASELANNTKMKTVERSEKILNLQKDEMIFFAKELKDELTGNKIDLFA